MNLYFGIFIIVILIFFVYSKTRKKEHSNSELVNVKTETVDKNKTQISIEINEKEIIRQLKKGKLQFNKNPERAIDDLAGFYGIKTFSEDKTFCITKNSGYYQNEKWVNGKIALFKDKELLFKKELERPNDCIVNNNGTVICCDWLNSEELTGKFYVFDKFGKELFSFITKANLGICQISENSKIALFETANSDNNDGHKIFIVDVFSKKIIERFEKPIYFRKAIFYTNRKEIILKDKDNFDFLIDYKGNLLNEKNYDKKILENGNVRDIIFHFEDKPEEIKYNHTEYLNFLNKILKLNDKENPYGTDLIYRNLGEFYEKKGNISKTIECWEKALEINPKVGIKRRLNKYKKNEK